MGPVISTRLFWSNILSEAVLFACTLPPCRRTALKIKVYKKKYIYIYVYMIMHMISRSYELSQSRQALFSDSQFTSPAEAVLRNDRTMTFLAT